MGKVEKTTEICYLKSKITMKMNKKKATTNNNKKVNLGDLFKKFGLDDVYKNTRNDFPFQHFLDFFEKTEANLSKYAESMAEYQLFPDISKFIAPGSKRVIFIKFLIDIFYNSNTFSIKKSKEIIMESVERLSQNYDIIPLVYTTLKSPAPTDYPPHIWRDILSANSFKQEDNGQLEFLDAILELRDKKLINISYIGTKYADKDSLVIEAGVWKTGKDLFIKNQTQNGEKIDLLGISYEQALFLIKLVFGHIFRILEAVSTGYIYIVDENLNAKYVLLSDDLNGLLKRKDFEELKKELPPDLLPKHLFEPVDEMDVWWEHGGQSGMMSFIGDIEAAWVRAGQQTFPLPEWLIQYFNDIDNATIQHRKNKATQWEHITKNIEERKARGEFSFEQPQKQEGEKERILKLEISKMPELVIRNAEDNIFTKGKKRIHLPKFKSTDWAKITIRFLDERNVLINADKKEQVVADYETLGFADEKRDKPNMAWAFFRGLAQNNGETRPLPNPIPDSIKQQKKQLSDRLITIFKNDTPPFYDLTEKRTYKIKINLIPPQSEDEKSDKYGTREYLKETMTEEYEEKYEE